MYRRNRFTQNGPSGPNNRYGPTQQNRFQNNRGYQQRGKNKRWTNRYGRNNWYNRQNMNREASIKAEPEWEKHETIDFGQFSKLATKNVTSGDDIVTCGSVRLYDKRHDRVNLKHSRKLRSDIGVSTEFHYVTTSEDTEIRPLVKS